MEKELKDFEAFLNDRLKNGRLYNVGSETHSKVKINKGRKFYKVIAGTSVYCFIAREDNMSKSLGYVRAGSLMKPANFNTPAKHARGNIFKQETWNLACGEYGMAYMR
jgi:hypothetical protein